MSTMAKSVMTAKPTPKSKFSTALQARKQALVTFGATLAGFAAGIPVTLAFMLSGASPVAAKVVQMTPASATLSCSQPAATTSTAAGGAGGGQVLGDSTSMPPVGGQGGGDQTPPPFVQHMIGGDLTANGSITGPTGPDSTNTVTSNQTETASVTNTNNLTVNNYNSQTSSTGNANVSGNTTGGSATTGDAWNGNSSSFNFVVNN